MVQKALAPERRVGEVEAGEWRDEESSKTRDKRDETRQGLLYNELASLRLPVHSRATLEAVTVT